MLKTKKFLKLFSLSVLATLTCAALALGLSACGDSSVEDESDATELEYTEYSAELSATVSMGPAGTVNFGEVLTGAYIAESDGVYYLKLTFGKAELAIMNITTTAFVDVAPEGTRISGNGLEAGTIGYYNESGELVTEGVTYVLSEDTATNSNGDSVNYVTEAVMPVDSLRSEYKLAFFVNSDSSGVQFCELVEGQTTNYSATLTLDIA